MWEINATCVRYARKDFSRKAELKRHFPIHSGEKKFTCEECKKGFFRKDDLPVHLRCHTEEKPFICEICS